MTILLEVISGPETDYSYQVKTTFGIYGGSIGRDRDCTLCLPSPDKSISRIHGHILMENGKFQLVDSSVNGIFVNHAREPLGHERRHILQAGDILEIGPFTIRTTIPEKESDINHHDAGLPLDNTVMTQADDKRISPSLTTYIARKKNDFGDTIDHFSPPEISIPANWDLDPPRSEKATNPVSVVQFTSRHSKLISALFEGFGNSIPVSEDQINAETMKVIGQLFYAAIDGYINTRSQIYQAKSRLSFDKISHARQCEADPLGDIESTQAFFAALLDSRHPLQPLMAEKLKLSLQYCREDMNDLLEGNQIILDKVFSDLSPESIAVTLASVQNAAATTSDLTATNLNDGLSSGARKWAFFQKNWKVLFSRLSVSVRKDYESRFLLSHVKRMGLKNESK